MWVTNEEVNNVFAAQGDIKAVNRVLDNGVATGIREVVFFMREGEQKHLPYLTCIMTIPGRHPICFRCEGVGHLRHQCPYGHANPGPRSYASAAQGPAGGKRVERPVDCSMQVEIITYMPGT
uniref:Uncharacterized protein n=1 Tax=Magallana gigas TaxID=29159 RepID=K1Q855_MAGGI